jgi:hypothetical protein
MLITMHALLRMLSEGSILLLMLCWLQCWLSACSLAADGACTAAERVQVGLTAALCVFGCEQHLAGEAGGDLGRDAVCVAKLVWLS